MSKKVNFIESQLKAINVSRNAVVSAGAGSGKTTVLAARFLHLIKEYKYNVDEILTLTFTKKATTEMSDRIYKVLQAEDPVQAGNFYKANIKTLDSYCASVARLGAHYYGISPDFVQDDATINRLVNQEALPFILEHRDNIAIKTFITTKDYATIAENTFVSPIMENSSIAQSIDFRSNLKNQTSLIIDLYNKTTSEISEKISELFRAYDDYDGNRNTKFMTSLADVLENNRNLPEAPAINLDVIKSGNYKEIAGYAKLIQSISSIKQTGTNQAQDGMKKPLNDLKILTVKLITVSNFIYGYNISLELIPLLEEFQQKVNSIKRTTGILTFNDVAGLALQTLIDYPEIRNIEKQKFKAIMIDEFQDNNKKQRDMLFLLAENLDRNDKSIPEPDELISNKLFFVGDEKQSIYKFRGADVSVFRNLSNDFLDGQLEMSTNFRSNQALIASFNTFFGGVPYPTENSDSPALRPSIFHTEDNAANANIFDAIYHNAELSESAQKEANDPEKRPAIYEPKIHFGFYDKNQTANQGDCTEEAAEIIWIAKKIRELIDNGTDPSEIAVLIRSYALQPQFEKTFLNYGIPYNAEVITGFFSDGPVNDLIAYLRLCTFPKETISYSQVLCSPFVNLSLADSQRIIKLGKEPFSSEAESLLDGESLQRYKNATLFWKNFNSTLNKKKITQAITELWYDSGYRFETLWNQTVEMYSKMYDMLFELARKADISNTSLADFVDSTQIYKDDSIKLEDMDIPLEKSSGVHILTIHKSKGLEYDVVFIPNTHRKGSNDINDKQLYYSEKYGISINTPACPEFASSKTNYFFDSAKAEEAKMEAAELRRLVYVAVTRAKKQIYITNGKYKASEDAEKYLPDGDSNPSTIYNVLEPIVNYYYDPKAPRTNIPFDVEHILPQPRAVPENTNLRRNTNKEKIELLATMEKNKNYCEIETVTCQEPENIHISPSHLHAADEETGSPIVESSNNIRYNEINQIVASTIPNSKNIANPEPRFSFADFGTIAHAYMEAGMKGEEPNPPTRNFSGLENNTQKIEAVKNICLQMSQAFLKSEIGQKAKNSIWHKTEYEFKSFVAGKIVNGFIDLVFKDTDGTYYILDYKTNQSVVPEIYYNQLACYRQAISQIRQVEDAKSIKCYLYYLRFGEAVEITDECNKVNIEQEIQNLNDSKLE